MTRTKVAPKSSPIYAEAETLIWHTRFCTEYTKRSHNDSRLRNTSNMEIDINMLWRAPRPNQPQLEICGKSKHEIWKLRRKKSNPKLSSIWRAVPNVDCEHISLGNDFGNKQLQCQALSHIVQCKTLQKYKDVKIWKHLGNKQVHILQTNTEFLKPSSTGIPPITPFWLYLFQQKCVWRSVLYQLFNDLPEWCKKIQCIFHL